MTEMPIGTIVGSLNGKALHVVTITAAAYQRVRELTAAGAFGADWIEDGLAVGYARLKTTSPQTLIDLDRTIAAAR